MTEITEKRSDENTGDVAPNAERRHLIRKTLSGAAGVYVGMAVLDAFVGPKIGLNGMPANAVSIISD